MARRWALYCCLLCAWMFGSLGTDGAVFCDYLRPIAAVCRLVNFISVKFHKLCVCMCVCVRVRA